MSFTCHNHGWKHDGNPCPICHPSPAPAQESFGDVMRKLSNEAIAANHNGIADVTYRANPANALKPEVPEARAEDIVKPLSSLDDLSQEEVLYYATPYFNELQEKKALRAQQLKDNPNG